MFENVFSHTKSLVVHNLTVCFEGAWKHACNTHVYIVHQMAATSYVATKIDFNNNNNNNNNDNNTIIFIQDNSISVINTVIKGGPVIKNT